MQAGVLAARNLQAKASTMFQDMAFRRRRSRGETRNAKVGQMNFKKFWRSPLLRPSLPLLILALVAASPAKPLRASVIIDSQALSAGIDNCHAGAIQFQHCKSLALISDQEATVSSTFLPGPFNGPVPTAQTFGTAFNNWNAANGNLWTLADGGNLSIDFHITIEAFAAAEVGGAGLTATFLYDPDPGDPELGALGWVQALYINYRPPDEDLLTPTTFLDTYDFSKGGSPLWGGEGSFSISPCAPFTATLATNNPQVLDSAMNVVSQPYCGPIYPFQFADNHFVDFPRGGWPDDSFRAIALLATVDPANHVLTVYEGFSWGFDLKIPEPDSIVLFVTSLFAILGLRLIGRRRSAPA